jgi:uncharacterized membrane protein YuzA (DUF378 family)
MVKKLKLMILSLSYVFALLLPAAIAVPAYAAVPPETTNIQQHLCSGSNLDLTDKTCTTSNLDAGQNATDVITKIINILSVVIGAIAVLMIIFGGFRYVTSAGSAEGTKSARQTIIYAIVGLVVVALAQIIVHFVLNTVSSS